MTTFSSTDTTGNQKEFKPKSWAVSPIDLAKEHDAWEADQTRDTGPTPEESYAENIQHVKQGKLNPGTGAFALSPKARTISRWNPSPRFKSGFDQIRWD